MSRIITQIYEVQTPREAEQLIELGVDRLGSVVVSEAGWRQPLLRETIAQVNRSASCSSLIPLFSDPDAIFRILEYYRPHTVHFCEILPPAPGREHPWQPLVALQESVKEAFPEIKIMRTIAFPAADTRQPESLTAVVRAFEPFSDYFLTDTLLEGDPGSAADPQPVAGFVGITGKPCDWSHAAKLVQTARIPVILAGGIGPHNVVEGILRVRPAGVDSCTLTNARDSQGRPIRFKKDMDKVKQLLAETRRAERILAEGGALKKI